MVCSHKITTSRGHTAPCVVSHYSETGMGPLWSRRGSMPTPSVSFHCKHTLVCPFQSHTDPNAEWRPARAGHVRGLGDGGPALLGVRPHRAPARTSEQSQHTASFPQQPLHSPESHSPELHFQSVWSDRDQLPSPPPRKQAVTCTKAAKDALCVRVVWR